MPNESRSDVTSSPLGRRVEMPTMPDARVLFPLERAAARAEIGIDPQALPFVGADLWNAYELSWLDARGKPHVALAELQVPADSPCLIESKSLKLYLSGYAQSHFDDTTLLRGEIARDLADAAGATVAVALIDAEAFGSQTLAELPGISLDGLDIDIDDYGPPQPDYLRVDARAQPVEETLATRLFRSHCPVTGQPDWATVQIRYTGAPIDRAGLLRYLVSWRGHSGFHETCVESIFTHIVARCAPQMLRVYARFTRRGGLDINPWRASPGHDAPPRNVRTARQ